MEDFQFSIFFMSLYLQVFLKKDYSISSVTREKVTLSFSLSSMQSQRLIFKIHIASYLFPMTSLNVICFHLDIYVRQDGSHFIRGYYISFISYARQNDIVPSIEFL